MPTLYLIQSWFCIYRCSSTPSSLQGSSIHSPCVHQPLPLFKGHPFSHHVYINPFLSSRAIHSPALCTSTPSSLQGPSIHSPCVHQPLPLFKGHPFTRPVYINPFLSSRAIHSPALCTSTPSSLQGPSIHPPCVHQPLPLFKGHPFTRPVYINPFLSSRAIHSPALCTPTPSSLQGSSIHPPCVHQPLPLFKNIFYKLETVDMQTIFLDNICYSVAFHHQVEDSMIATCRIQPCRHPPTFRSVTTTIQSVYHLRIKCESRLWKSF